MNDYIKLAVIPNDNPISGKNKDGEIDFIFDAIKESDKPVFLTKTLTIDDDISEIIKYLNEFSKNEIFGEYYIYHFNLFREYVKNNYSYLYDVFKLANPIFDNKKESFIDYLITVFQKLTDIGFITILNSEYTTMIFAPKTRITSKQKESLNKIKDLFSKEQMVSLNACCNGEIEKFRGNVDVIEQYLESLENRKKRN